MYKKARSADPADSSALFNIGLCYLDLENFAEARAYFQRHLAESPDDPVSLLEIANTHYAQGELEQSIRGYRTVLQVWCVLCGVLVFVHCLKKVKPDHYDCRAWLAATLLEAGRHMDAIAEFELLIKMSGKISFHYNISFIYLELSERAESPQESARLRRLSDMHAQLETGVRKEFVEKFFSLRENEFLKTREDIASNTEASGLSMRSCILLREESLP
jgi:tetratricopeptide (TPR) repeat protein